MKFKIVSILILALLIASVFANVSNMQNEEIECCHNNPLTIAATDTLLINPSFLKNKDISRNIIKSQETTITKENNLKVIHGDLKVIKSNQIIDQILLSDYHIIGDLIIELHNCSTLNMANLIEVKDQWVEGDIIVRWFGPQAIRIHIYNNPIVYGNITVEIRDVHDEDPDGIELLIFNNGENYKDTSKNQAVGNIIAYIHDNWCMPLIIGINNNWVHSNITMDIIGNQVNICTIGVYDNHAGLNCNIDFSGNDVDRVLDIDIRENNFGERLFFTVLNNPHFGWIEYKCPCVCYFNIIDNHCVRKDIQSLIQISSNTHYGMPFYTTIEDNGFGGNIHMEVTGNVCLMTGDMQNKFYRNKCDMIMTILVAGNQYIIKDYAADNTASDAVPSVTLQNSVEENNNIQQNPQNIGVDNDGDGLTDDYEKMIGTDVGNRDTDGDGLLDGWDDRIKDKKWDKGEKMGEIGDPLQEIDNQRNYGAIASLYNVNSENPNPINKDIFIEVDFLKECVVNVNTLQKVIDIFSKHCIRLHIDTGWPVGPAGGQPGGDVISAGWTHNGNTYLYFDTVGNRRILFPLKMWSNDFYDLKLGITDFKPRGYFNGGRTGAREDIFHYVVFANYLAEADSPINYDDSAYGVGEFGRWSDVGDDFMVCYENHIVGGTLDTAELQDTFMHELGHNLELDHSWEDDIPPNGSDPDPAVNPWPGKETVQDTVMFWSGGQKLDYLRQEWARINLAAVCDGTHLWYS